MVATIVYLKVTIPSLLNDPPATLNYKIKRKFKGKRQVEIELLNDPLLL